MKQIVLDATKQIAVYLYLLAEELAERVHNWLCPCGMTI